ncbi:MAG: primosomal protein N' [Clostridium sp.]|uniref:primosomal protein N' n=1 Tax=Clostridium sp. TaxID=1506 RepID=UPI002FCAFF8B
MINIIASVIVSNSSREVDREFDYKIPESLEDLVKVGSLVIIPFGLYNNYIEGIVVDIKEISQYDLSKVKYIADVLHSDLSLSEKDINLAKYIRNYYLSTLSDALNLMLPPRKNIKQDIYIKYISKVDGITKTEDNILDYLNEVGEVTLEKLNKDLNSKVKFSQIASLQKRGALGYRKDFTKLKNEKEEYVYYIDNECLCREFINTSSSRAKKQILLVKDLLENINKPYTLGEIKEEFNTSDSVIKSLVEKGIINKSLRRVFRLAYNREFTYDRVTLTEDQERVINSVVSSYMGSRNTTLLYGVTSSGKTEVYLNLVERFLKEGYSSIILVPEISLTPQTVERFKGRFKDVVAILHSRLSDGERFDEYMKIKSGKARVIIGARSAIFAPAKDLKLIIVDEEHESAYKSESSPRYNAKNIAKYRADIEGGLLLLSSATPSVESFYKAKIGEYNLEVMDKRYNQREMPSVTIADMKEELMMGNRSIFSRKLYSSIGNSLESNNQVILFLNRRGHSTFVSCRKCGYVCECDNCSVTLTYHHKARMLKCHHCSREYRVPTICPKCQSKYIKYFGVGTQRIEEETKKHFKDSSICRMDSDTTSKKGSYDIIYSDFKNKKYNILVGTQMISKGMDFKDVTTVGVISADISLNSPDFRAAERTFQLLTQVSGRCGRGDEIGEVVVQTYTPDHFSIRCAKDHDFITFYNEEIKIRQMLNYPPFTRLIHIVVTSINENLLKETCLILKDEIKSLISGVGVLIGPSPCIIYKIKDRYRYHFIIKGDIGGSKIKVLDLLQKNVQNKDISFMIDVDPYTLT